MCINLYSRMPSARITSEISTIVEAFGFYARHIRALGPFFIRGTSLFCYTTTNLGDIGVLVEFTLVCVGTILVPVGLCRYNFSTSGSV